MLICITDFLDGCSCKNLIISNYKQSSLYLNPHPHPQFQITREIINYLIKKNKIKFDSIQEIFYQKKNLEIFYYSDSYNKSIKELKYLIQLRSLTFGSDFNQPIDVLERLINLQSLTFGSYFNQPINVLERLINLQSFKIIFFKEKYDFKTLFRRNKV
jgi:hypothetical protein